MNNATRKTDKESPLAADPVFMENLQPRMSDSLDDWVARLASTPLPVMRRTLTRVRDLLYQTSTSHQVLAGVIRHDPGFTLFLFRQLEQLPHRPREPIDKLSNAIPMLGMGLVERAAGSLPCLEDQLQGPPRRGLIDCYGRAAHAAIYAARLAAWHNWQDPERFALAGLLHDLGEMALWSAAPPLMRQLQQRMAQGDGREDAALEVLGFTLEQLNQRLGEAWRLPSLVQASQGLYNSHLPEPLSVMMAAALARASSRGWQTRQTLDRLELLAELFEVPPHQAASRFHQMAAEAAREIHPLPLPLPAFDLPRALSAPRVEAAEVLRQTPTSPPRPKAEPAANPVPPAPKPAGAETDAPPARPARAINPLQERLIQTLRSLHQEQGLRRVMFAMLTPDRGQIKVRFVVEREERDSLQGLTIDLGRPSLFVALLKRPQALWIHRDNREKYQAMLPREVRPLLGDQDCLLMSIFLKQRPIGLILADNGGDGVPLTDLQYQNFKLSCRQLIAGLD